jgi:hypothetical protein
MKFLFALLLCLAARADEGMWPYSQVRADVILEKYKFEASAPFLEKLRLASVRITGGSGSFVSPNGLMITNQHIAAGCLAKQSSVQHDYLRDGFYADTRQTELPCPGLEAEVLLKVEDVTAQIKTAATEKTAAAQAVELRRAAMARVEKACAASSGNRCEVVKLYSGVRYDLYQYKPYADLRLVFAPEYDLAFFGKERDAITYLRYGMDIAFLRAYENGNPASTPHFLKWASEAVKEGDLVFTAGNPEPTLRLATSSQLTFYRDTVLPLALGRLQPRIVSLREYAAKSEENLRAAQPVLSPLMTSYKLAAGKLIGLRDDRLVSKKTIFQGKVRRAVERDPKLGEAAAKVWDEMAAAYKTWTPSEKLYELLENDAAPGSNLFRIARQIVRTADEKVKSDDQRLPEYKSWLLPGLEKSLNADAPVNDAIEVLMLTQYLEELKKLSAKEVPVKAILAGRTPQQAAEAYVQASKLKDPAERMRLASSRDMVRKSTDGMIKLALLLDDPARKIRKKQEQVLGSLEASAAEKIAQYRLMLFTVSEYPDATGTPRVAYGVVKSYTDRAGVPAPFASTFGGLYYRKDKEGPYMVPARWVELRDKLDLVAPMDFVSTCDIGGGDPGSPTVNRAGELVGVTFDGNLESLPNIYLYTDEKARAVHVSVQGIVEALTKAYKTPALLKELGR